MQTDINTEAAKAVTTATQLDKERRKGRNILLICSSVCALIVLDTNIVAVSLPSVARSLHADFSDIEWVVSAYMLAFASLLLPAGSLADRFGRKRMMLLGLSLFSIASLGCGLAWSVEVLQLARALKGVGAAMLLTSALAVIGHVFHTEKDRTHAWAVWGACMGVSMTVAPLLGGVITQLLGWRWIFLLNLPVCGCLALLVYRRGSAHRSLGQLVAERWIVLRNLGADQCQRRRLDQCSHLVAGRWRPAVAGLVHSGRADAATSDDRLAAVSPRTVRRCGAGHVRLCQRSPGDDDVPAAVSAECIFVFCHRGRSGDAAVRRGDDAVPARGRCADALLALAWGDGAGHGAGVRRQSAGGRRRLCRQLCAGAGGHDRHRQRRRIAQRQYPKSHHALCAARTHWHGLGHQHDHPFCRHRAGDCLSRLRVDGAHRQFPQGRLAGRQAAATGQFQRCSRARGRRRYRSGIAGPWQ